MVLWREVVLSERLCHVVVVGKGEATLVLPRLLGSEGDAEPVPKPLVVEDDGGERMDGGVRLYQLSPTVMTKSRLPKRTCAPGTQLTLWLAIQGLVWNAQRPLPGAPIVGVSNKHRLVNL